MRERERHRFVRQTVVAGVLLASATGAACAHRGSVPPEGATASVLDSVRDAKARRQSPSSGAQSVSFSEADRNRFTSVAQMIQARFSGVVVQQSGGTHQIRISGAESFIGGNEPLVIVDGATMNSTTSLDAVNPRDVVRIEVLKDAAASLYGVRGGNGVIVVSTRRTP